MDAARPCELWVQAIRTPPVGNNSLCLSKWLSRSIVANHMSMSECFNIENGDAVLRTPERPSESALRR
jgi:hypothetical protein